MKRFFLLAVFCLTATSVSGADPSSGDHPERVFWVVSSDVPEYARRPGPNVWLCDLKADDVQVQAAIDAAEAVGSGAMPAEVHFSSGRYSFTTPIYDGYASGVPEGTAGCSLIGHGFVQIGWAGATQTTDKFLINVAPSDSQQYGLRIEGFKLWSNGKINGMFMQNCVRARVRDILFLAPLSMGLVTNDSWTGTYDNLLFTYAKGQAIVAIGANVTSFRNISLDSNCVDTNVPYLRAYTMDSSIVNDYRLLETVSATGGETGVVVGWSDTVLYVAHDVDDDFDDGDSVTGATSSFSETVDNDASETRNCEAAIYIRGGTTDISMLNWEQCDFSTTHDCPLLLAEGSNASIRNLRFEVGATSSANRRLTSTWVNIRNMQNAVIENVKGAGNGAQLVESVSNLGGGSKQVDGISSTQYARLNVGDIIYLWEVDGSDDDFTDGPYTIASKDGAGVDAYQVTLETDPGGTDDRDGGSFAYLLSLADRDSPVDLIKLENADGVTVHNPWGYGFGNSIVNIGSDCDRTVVVKPFEQMVDTYQTYSAESGWLYHCKPRQIVLNAGTHTTIINPQTFNAIVDPGGNALVYAGSNYDDGDLSQENQKIGFDGIQLASASPLAIGTAFGPHYRIYLTGSTTPIASITGGYLGQVITLISYGASITLTDSATLNVGAGDYAIPQYGAIQLICNNAAGTSWEAVGVNGL